MIDQEAKFICSDCVAEEFLSQEVEETGDPGLCSYCNKMEKKCISVESLADYIDSAFERHYILTSDQPNSWESTLLSDRESDYEWERHGEPVLYAIAEAAQIDEKVAEDVLELLQERHSDYHSHEVGEECEFDSDSYYELRDVRDGEYAYDFRMMEDSLRSENRYFNKTATSFLERLFLNIHSVKTHDGSSVVVSAGPNCITSGFFRARVFHKSEDLASAIERPDIHLGPPPGHLARAGRMNAHGVSVFYGASEPSVALAEVRPPVGSRALVARFDLLREIKLLDVEALQSVFVDGSIFDPTYAEDLKLAKFLARLSARITRPVMPDDEPTEYLITQLIADYLSQRPVPGLDGILFPSVQCAGASRNVVVFNHACRVAKIEIPNGTDLSSNQSITNEDGLEPDYYVWESVESHPDSVTDNTISDSAKAKFPNFLAGLQILADLDSDSRTSTFRIVLESVTVYHVNGVTFDLDKFSVRRQRIGKHDIPF